MVEPQIYGVPEKSKTFWGEEEQRRERAYDFLERKSRRERYTVRDDDGRGTKTRTLDTRFWRPLLYQLSYTPKCLIVVT